MVDEPLLFIPIDPQMELFASDRTAQKLQFKPKSSFGGDWGRKLGPNYEKILRKIGILRTKS